MFVCGVQFLDQLIGRRKTQNNKAGDHLSTPEQQCYLILLNSGRFIRHDASQQRNVLHNLVYTETHFFRRHQGFGGRAISSGLQSKKTYCDRSRTAWSPPELVLPLKATPSLAVSPLMRPPSPLKRSAYTPVYDFWSHRRSYTPPFLLADPAIWVLAKKGRIASPREGGGGEGGRRGGGR